MFERIVPMKSMPISAFALALLPLFVWLTKRVGEQRKKVTAERQASLADVSSLVHC